MDSEFFDTNILIAILVLVVLPLVVGAILYMTRGRRNRK